jgi:hypothetical protein
MAKKEYLELTLSLDDLLDIPDMPKEISVDYIKESEFSEIGEIEIENTDVLSVKELEDSMSDVHGINSIKDLRPDDYKGISINMSKLFNMFKKRKG